MKTHHDIPGWFDWPQLYEEIVTTYSGGILVEVGTYLGRSLCYLGKLVKESGKPFQVVGIDWCVGSGVENGEDNHRRAVREGNGSFASQLHRNVIECGLQGIISILVADSVQASRLFADNSLTMVFIDTRHDFDSVKRDILTWRPKVKMGGTLAGDDVGVPDEENPVWPEVKQALNCCLPGWQYAPHDAWKFRKK